MCELFSQDANAKLEKADVLEMTVVFLKQRLQPRHAHSLGYSCCWKETMHFLSASSLKPPATSHVQAAAKPLAAPDGVVWRPW